jgi:D-3-phosphoglycerate dehydrogenase
MTYRIQTLNAISPTGLSHLPRDRYDVGPDLTEPDALLVRSADLLRQPIPGSVLAVVRAGVGTNNIPVADLSNRGIPVFNTPGANANAVKELVLAGLLLAARNIIPAWSFAQGLTGDDAQIARTVEAGKKQFAGFELSERTLGVIGLGAIGVLVANSARALGLRVLGCDPKLTVDRAWQLSPDVQITSLEDLFTRSDAISVHVPLVESTKGLVNAERLAMMKRSPVLLNFARGGIVEEQAVLSALDDGRLRAYVCDFPSAALNAHPKVVALPHLGASTGEAEENCAVMAADQLRSFLEDGHIKNSVNYPEANLPRAAGTRRLAIANRNVPNMVGQISTLLAGANLNIADLLNKSRGDLAYTLIDVDGEVSGEAVEAIRTIDGVLSIRLI